METYRRASGANHTNTHMQTFFQTPHTHNRVFMFGKRMLLTSKVEVKVKVKLQYMYYMAASGE